MLPVVVSRENVVTLDVLFAGSFFPSATNYLREALPDVRVAVANPATDDVLPAARILVPLMTRIDGAVMDRVDDLRIVHQWGAGLEGVDIPAATARGIAVANIPTTTSGNAASVAEWCVMAALAMSRQLLDHKAIMANGTTWGSPVGQGLRGRTAGIVGFGGIGQALAKRLVPFETRVIVATRTPDAELAASLGVDSVVGMDQFDAFLAEVDYVFLTLPLTPETRHLMDARTFALLKAGAYAINVGRGGLVDHEALLAALDDGHLAGAALDVFAQEPLDPTSPLIAHPKTLVSPHIAGVTDVFYRHAAQRFVDALARLRTGAPLDFAINWSAISGQ